MNVDEVIDRMRIAYAVPDLEALARLLDMSPLGFRVWRTRKKVPPKVLIKVSNDTGKSVSWLGGGVPNASDHVVREPAPVFFAPGEKQVNLSAQEQALIDNFRAATAEGRAAIEAASAALAKPAMKKKKRA